MVVFGSLGNSFCLPLVLLHPFTKIGLLGAYGCGKSKQTSTFLRVQVPPEFWVQTFRKQTNLHFLRCLETYQILSNLIELFFKLQRMSELFMLQHCFPQLVYTTFMRYNIIKYAGIYMGKWRVALLHDGHFVFGNKQKLLGSSLTSVSETFCW